MVVLGFLLLALAPAIFWLWFYIRKDSYRSAPRRLLALTFVLGMLSTVPAGLLEFLFLDESVVSRQESIATVAAAMLFVVGPVEELSKFVVVCLVPY